jgi:hypothetical protein
MSLWCFVQYDVNTVETALVSALLDNLAGVLGLFDIARYTNYTYIV